jgi:capsular polysaccharide biosynthesis protein
MPGGLAIEKVTASVFGSSGVFTTVGFTRQCSVFVISYPTIASFPSLQIQVIIDAPLYLPSIWRTFQGTIVTIAGAAISMVSSTPEHDLVQRISVFHPLHKIKVDQFPEVIDQGYVKKPLPDAFDSRWPHN